MNVVIVLKLLKYVFDLQKGFWLQNVVTESYTLKPHDAFDFLQLFRLPLQVVQLEVVVQSVEYMQFVFPVEADQEPVDRGLNFFHPVFKALEIIRHVVLSKFLLAITPLLIEFLQI